MASSPVMMPDFKVLSCEGEAMELVAKLQQALNDMGVTANNQFKIDGACASLSEPCPHTSARDCHCQLTTIAIQGFPFSSAAVIHIHSMEGRSLIGVEQVGTDEEARLLHTVIQAALAT